MSDKVKDGTVSPYCRKYGYSLRIHVLNHTATENRHTPEVLYGAARLSNTSKLKNFENLTDSWPSSVITDLLILYPNTSHRQMKMSARTTFTKLQSTATTTTLSLLLCQARPCRRPSSQRRLCSSTIRADTDEWEIRARVATQKKY